MAVNQSGTNHNDITPQRRRRIQIIKRMIIGIRIASVIIPIVICIILVCRIFMLQTYITQLESKLAEKTITQENASEKNIEAENPISTDQDTDNIMNQAENGKTGVLSETVSSNDKESDQTVRKVYLTFDDGPSEETDTILDILEEYQVKATFFVVGKEDPKYDVIYKRIVSEGHTLGMHSYSHDYSSLYDSKENFIDDLEKLQQFLYDRTGVRSTFYRFPGGSSNTVSKVDMNDLIQVLNEKEITYFDWNVSAGDASDQEISSDTIVNNVLTEIKEFQHTAIVLMHDADDKQTTVEALPKLIESIEAMDNTEIVPITKDTFPVHHKTQTQEE